MQHFKLKNMSYLEFCTYIIELHYEEITYILLHTNSTSLQYKKVKVLEYFNLVSIENQ